MPNPRSNSAGGPDMIFRAFLEQQWRAARQLAAESDVLQLAPVDGDPPQAYLVHLACRTLVHTGGAVVRAPSGIGEAEGAVGGVGSGESAATVREVVGCTVGVRFPPDYLHTAHAAGVLAWLEPEQIWHPNIRPPFICVGNVTPGTPLVELVYRVHEIATWNKVTMHEGDALNWPACAWARQNLQRFPVDTRPLKRRVRAFDIEFSAPGVEACS